MSLAGTSKPPSGLVERVNVKGRGEGDRGIPKRPVPRARFTPEGVEGDYNRFRAAKQGNDPRQAILVMPRETLEELASEGWPVEAGDFGENVTTQGIPYAAFEPGTQWRVGEALLEITKACTPCTFLGVLPYVGPGRVAEFIKTTLGRRGWYASVIEAGEVGKGDLVRRVG